MVCSRCKLDSCSCAPGSAMIPPRNPKPSVFNNFQNLRQENAIPTSRPSDLPEASVTTGVNPPQSGSATNTTTNGQILSQQITQSRNEVNDPPAFFPRVSNWRNNGHPGSRPVEQPSRRWSPGFEAAPGQNRQSEELPPSSGNHPSGTIPKKSRYSFDDFAGPSNSLFGLEPGRDSNNQRQSDKINHHKVPTSRIREPYEMPGMFQNENDDFSYLYTTQAQDASSKKDDQDNLRKSFSGLSIESINEIPNGEAPWNKAETERFQMLQSEREHRQAVGPLTPSQPSTSGLRRRYSDSSDDSISPVHRRGARSVVDPLNVWNGSEQCLNSMQNKLASNDPQDKEISDLLNRWHQFPQSDEGAAAALPFEAAVAPPFDIAAAPPFEAAAAPPDEAAAAVPFAEAVAAEAPRGQSPWRNNGLTNRSTSNGTLNAEAAGIQMSPPRGGRQNFAQNLPFPNAWSRRPHATLEEILFSEVEVVKNPRSNAPGDQRSPSSSNGNSRRSPEAPGANCHCYPASKRLTFGEAELPRPEYRSLQSQVLPRDCACCKNDITTAWCQNCNIRLCPRCSQQHFRTFNHSCRWIPVRAQVELDQLQESLLRTVPRSCPQHNWPITLCRDVYCVDCGIWLCYECLKQHLNHALANIVSIMQNAANLKNRVRDAMGKMHQKLQYRAERFPEYREGLSRSQAELLASIQHFYEREKARLDEARNLLLNNAQAYGANREEHYNNQEQEFQRAMQSYNQLYTYVINNIQTIDINMLIVLHSHTINGLTRIASQLQSEVAPYGLYLVQPPRNPYRSGPLGTLTQNREEGDNAFRPVNSNRNRPIYNLPALVLVADKQYLNEPSVYISMVKFQVNSSLMKPWGICCDTRGFYYVADRASCCIHVYDTMGVPLRQISGRFNKPTGVAITPTGFLVIVDKDNHRICVCTLDGKELYTFGRQGSSDGEFQYPWDVAVNRNGTLAVTDSKNARIQFFTTKGAFLGKLVFDPEVLRNVYPRGIAFGPKGELVITDFDNHRILRFVGRANEYILENIFGLYESFKNGMFSRPQQIVVDDHGYMVVADSKNNRVQILKPNGRFHRSIGKQNLFERPCGVTLNPSGGIAVVDLRNRVLIFNGVSYN